MPRKSKSSPASASAAVPSTPSSAPTKSHFVLTIADCVRELQVSRAQIFRLLASGDLGAIKIGRRTLVPITEIEKLIAARLDEAANS